MSSYPPPVSLTLLPILAGGLISMPELSSDFLRKYMPRSIFRPITATFLLDPEGKVVTCEVEAENLDERRKDEICAKTIGKRAGTPSIGPDGLPVHGFVTGGVFEVSGGRLANPPKKELAEADLTLLVTSLPDGATNASIGMLAYIDENGRVKKCRPFRAAQEELFEAACLQTTGHSFPVVEGSDGSPVGYIDQISVNFEVEQPAS